MKYILFICILLIARTSTAFDLKPIPPTDSTMSFTSAPATLEFRQGGYVPHGPNSPNVELPPIPSYANGGPMRQVCDEFGCRLEPVGMISPVILANMDGGGVLPRREHRVERRGDRDGFLRGLLSRLFDRRGRVSARRDHRGGS